MARPNVIRDLGDTLIRLLQAGLGPLVDHDNDRVYLASPAQFSDISVSETAAVTVCLYRVAINAETRNGPRRTRDDGQITRPLLPIDLHFLVTPWTSNVSDGYRIVGRILQLLYDYAELGPSQLQGDAWD